jgi:hypothetical protein
LFLRASIKWNDVLRWAWLVCLLAGASLGAVAQPGGERLQGLLVDSLGKPVPGARVSLEGSSQATFTDEQGQFRLRIPASGGVVLVRHIGFTPQRKVIKGGATQAPLKLVLVESVTESMEVEIATTSPEREQVSTISLDPQSVKLLPSPTGDFNRILATLPGVVANNELSSTYSVRGGNYDENLVYVNDMEIYRPFLVRAGQQEGLSFVNPDMVKRVSFSTGGWQPRFGDKLSSVLDIEYKQPKAFGGTATVGLLYQAASFEGISRSKRFSYIVGLRRKSTQYLYSPSWLFNGLPVKGQYLPNFVDAQSALYYNLSSARDSVLGRSTTIGLLSSYAYNRYLVRPESETVDIGTVTSKVRIRTAFEGQELLEFRTYQSGLKLSHTFNSRAKSDVTFNMTASQERENFEVEGAFFISQVSTDFGNPNFNEETARLGTGSYYSYGRNKLNAYLFNLLNRNYLQMGNSQVEYGVSVGRERIVDRLYTYNFNDSTGYVRFTEFTESPNELNTLRTAAYVQQSLALAPGLTVTYGGRLAWWSLNQEYLLSPRAQASYQPQGWKRDWVFRASAGRYVQPPFYRELRNNAGELNRDLKAQKSIHAIAGSDYRFDLFGREFKFTAEGYYKAIADVVPYDVDNVRLRYFANNQAQAYAAGADFRVAGEFIKGAESWFSLGLLQTKENLDQDTVGWVRRPTDQRVTFAAAFQDHLVNNPSVRFNLNLQFGTGLPFGPPNDINGRGRLRTPAYRRVDVGFSKVISLPDKGWLGRQIDIIWLGLDVLNLLGTANTISYTWLYDFDGRGYAKPNTLSQRFVNAKVIVTFGN